MTSLDVNGMINGGDMNGKVVVISGASGGVGKETARALARLGARVVLVGRNEAKLREVATEIGGAEVLTGEVGVVKDCRRMAGEIERRFGRVDVLIHNAAAIPQARSETPEGIETAFAVNALGPYAFTLALEGLLAKSAPSRVIFLVGQSAPTDLDDLNFQKGEYNGWVAYQRTKFASLLVLKDLAERFASKNITVNGAFPGIVNTPGMDDAINANSFGGRVMLSLMRPFMRTPAKGAESSAWVASAPEFDRETGKLWSIKKPLGMPIKGIDDVAMRNSLVEKLDAMLKAV